MAKKFTYSAVQNKRKAKQAGPTKAHSRRRKILASPTPTRRS